MPYGTPSKDMKRPPVPKKSDGWSSWKQTKKASTEGDGPLSKANTWGDQDYKGKE